VADVSQTPQMLCAALEPRVYQFEEPGSSSVISSVMLIFSGTATLGDCSWSRTFALPVREDPKAHSGTVDQLARRLALLISGSMSHAIGRLPFRPPSTRSPAKTGHHPRSWVSSNSGQRR
jgi:hypothetical protein